MHYYPPTENSVNAPESIYDVVRQKRSNINLHKNRPVVNQPLDEDRKVVHRVMFGDTDTAVHSCQFSGDDKFIAVGYGDGCTRIYNL
jgi:hypothetical protein